METISWIVGLLCTGLCCLGSMGVLLVAIWILTRASPSATAAAGEQRAAVTSGPRAALSTTPPDPRLGRPREPAAETAILPTPAPQAPSLRAAVADLDGEEADMETVVATPAAPEVGPTMVPPLPLRSPETPHPALPKALGEEGSQPEDSKKTPGPRSSGQTIIAFDDDDEDW